MRCFNWHMARYDLFKTAVATWDRKRHGYGNNCRSRTIRFAVRQNARAFKVEVLVPKKNRFAYYKKNPQINPVISSNQSLVGETKPGHMVTLLNLQLT